MKKPLTKTWTVPVIHFHCDECDRTFAINQAGGCYQCLACKQYFCFLCYPPSVGRYDENNVLEWWCDECHLKNIGCKSKAEALNKGLASAKKTTENFNKVFGRRRVEQEVCEICSDQFNTKVTPEMNFIKECDVDSLDFLELIMIIEAEFEIDIPDSSFVTEKTYEDGTIRPIVDYVLQEMG